MKDRRIKRKRRPILVAVIAAGVLAYVMPPLLTWLDRTNKETRGYCFVEQRYLSDRELEDAVIRHIITKLLTAPPVWYDRSDPNTVIYSLDDPDYFRRLNPDFEAEHVRDSFDRNGRPGRVGSRTQGGEMVFPDTPYIFDASVSFLVRPDQSKSDGSILLRIDACGDVIDSGWDGNPWGDGLSGTHVRTQAHRRALGIIP